MIRIEVTSEADVTRMVAAFTTLPVLRDCDYEVFLLPHIWPHDSSGWRRAWRKDGERGGTGQANTVHHAGELPPAGGPGGTGAVSIDALTEEDFRRIRRERLEYTERNGLMSPDARQELEELRAETGGPGAT